jgi:hypothetical protein
MYSKVRALGPESGRGGRHNWKLPSLRWCLTPIRWSSQRRGRSPSLLWR